MDANLINALERLKMEPVSFVIDPDSDNVELFLEDGVDLSVLRPTEAAETDVIGVYDVFTQGDSAEFEITVPEDSKDVIDVLFPEGVAGTDDAATYRGFGRAAGHSMRGDALKVQIRPYSTRTSTANQVVLWLCAPVGDATLAKRKSGPHTYNMRWQAFPDLDYADGHLLGRIYAPARS